jgi:hypothetical protein
LLLIIGLFFPAPPQPAIKTASTVPEPPAQSSAYAPADPLPSVPQMQPGPLDARFSREADQYINGCESRDLSEARCAEMITEFKRDYIAARRGSYPAMRAIATALSTAVNGYDLLSSPYASRDYQGCAWALAAHIGVPADTDAGNPRLVLLACMWATTPGERALVQQRAETLIDEARHPTHLQPEIRFPEPGSRAARTADAIARHSAARYIEGCADYGGNDRRLCDFDVSSFILSYRRAMADDQTDGIENLIFSLNGKGANQRGIAIDHFEACAWAVVATDEHSPQTTSSDAMMLGERCSALSPAEQGDAIAHGRVITRQIELHPNAPPPDDQ